MPLFKTQYILCIYQIAKIILTFFLCPFVTRKNNFYIIPCARVQFIQLYSPLLVLKFPYSLFLITFSFLPTFPSESFIMN